MRWLDPDYLDEVSGTFERFLIINQHGNPDGMILADGAEVHFPPVAINLFAASGSRFGRGID
jgi:hypothetical protein